ADLVRLSLRQPLLTPAEKSPLSGPLGTGCGSNEKRYSSTNVPDFRAFREPAGVRRRVERLTPESPESSAFHSYSVGGSKSVLIRQTLLSLRVGDIQSTSMIEPSSAKALIHARACLRVKLNTSATAES